MEHFIIQKSTYTSVEFSWDGGRKTSGKCNYLSGYYKKWTGWLLRRNAIQSHKIYIITSYP